VPKNGLKPATLVATASAALSSGFRRTSGVASRVPAVLNSLRAGPRELNPSGVAGVAWLEAAIVRAPRADEASGSIAPEFVACSAMEKTGVPPTMYFMNGLRVPATRRMPTPMVAVPVTTMDANSLGRCVAMLSLSAVKAKLGTPEMIV
jgi:hypothetical protein